MIADIIIIILLSAALFLIVRYMFKSHHAGKCIGCPGCTGSYCHSGSCEGHLEMKKVEEIRSEKASSEKNN